jgi:hypothetical protein
MKYSEILSAVPHMSDSNLNALIKFSTEELTKRAEKRKEMRAAWVKKMCDAYLSHPNACSHIRENLTIVAIYSHCCGTRIGTAFPVNGDTYNVDTGIAVAFAKAIGESVPDFV